MYTDQIFDIYIDIYNDVRKRRSYRNEEKDCILHTMCHLNMLLYSWINIPTSTDRSMDQAIFDYEKALKGVKYNHGSQWNNEHNFDSTGKRR